jgi:hypothetical protein
MHAVKHADGEKERPGKLRKLENRRQNFHGNNDGFIS